LARIHSGNRVFIEKVFSHPAIDDRTVEFLKNIESDLENPEIRMRK